jgi:hypothetical protein
MSHRWDLVEQPDHLNLVMTIVTERLEVRVTHDSPASTVRESREIVHQELEQIGHRHYSEALINVL